MIIEILSIEDIVPYASNPKRHPQAQIEKIAASIEQYGWTLPLLIDAENVLIAGHGRLAAAKLLDIAEVPAIRLSNLSEAEVRAYRIADNRLTEEGQWDRANLVAELEALSLEGFDLQATGFDSDFFQTARVNERAVIDGEEVDPGIPSDTGAAYVPDKNYKQDAPDDANPVISEPIANQLPKAIIRFYTDEAKNEFMAWLDTVDHDRLAKHETLSVNMPARVKDIQQDVPDDE